VATAGAACVVYMRALLSIVDDGRAEFDTSIVASMEVNGVVYQGVLFAQPPPPPPQPTSIVPGARI